MQNKDIVKSIIEHINSTEFNIDEINEINEALFQKHPYKHNPVSRIVYVNIEDIQPNDYNPNAVAKNELKLLETSIDHDGYTQPTVTIYDEELGKYVIIDGFHRYYVMKSSKLINERNKGIMPIVVLEKSINERMASTVRHNRARGKHSVTGMGNIVMEMLRNGATDEEVCNELGLEVDELVRLKYTSGIAKMFEDEEFSLSAKPTHQIQREYDPTQDTSEELEKYNGEGVKNEQQKQ